MHAQTTINETALGAALLKAGAPIHESALHVLAVDLLRRHGNTRLAIAPFVDEIRRPAGLLIALMGERLAYAVIRERAFKYLLRVEADMKNKPLPSGGQESHVRGAAHITAAPARQPNDDVEDHGHRATQAQPVPSSSPNRGGEDRGGVVTHTGDVHPVREPSKHDRAVAAAIAKRVGAAMIDSMKTSDGRVWGDVGAHELDGMVRDGAIAGLIKSKLGRLSNAQRFMPLRQLIKPDEFEQIIRSPREATHA